jgi:hypothetical protein
MGASFGYAGVDSPDMSWLPLSRFESRAAGVLQCMGEGEANGGGNGTNGMAVGPMGVGSYRGQCGIVPNKHTKQLHSKNSAQFYVVRPIHAAPAIPAYQKRPFACIWPPNGQTAKNRAKPSPPSRSPLNLSPEKKFPRPNGFSRRTRLSHEILPGVSS